MRHALPYVATTINLVMAIVLGMIALVSVQLGSPTALAYCAALGFAANAIRMWRKFNLAASVMALAFVSVIVLFGVGVVALRQLA